MPTEVRLTHSGTTATLTLVSPDGLHVLSRATLGALDRALEELSHDTQLRAVVLTGEGTRCFSAGADLRELAALDHESAAAFSGYGQGVAKAVARFPVPVIAAFNGPAFGGGIELALACDFRVGTTRARLQYQAAKLGLLPGWGGTQRLPAMVGHSRAKVMMLLSQPVAPEQALAWGLLDELVEPEALGATLARWTAELAGMERHAAVQIKRAIDLVASGDFAGEREAFAACFAGGRTQTLIREWLSSRATKPDPRS